MTSATTTTTTSAIAAVGDTSFLANYLINARLYAVVVPPGAEQEFVATFEVNGSQGTLTMAAMIGPQGPKGIDMFALYLQTDDIETPADLPTTLQDTVADQGKFWVFDDVDNLGNIIGSSGYIWFGTGWRRIMMGTPGPPGVVPVITPSVALVPPTEDSEVIPGGTAAFPTMEFDLAAPAGPQGPGAALAVAPDVDLTTNPPVVGDVLGWTGAYTTDTALMSPTSLTAVLTSAGSLVAGSYSYVVTAVNSSGESTPSNEVSVTPASTGAVGLAWSTVVGATSYNVYRGNTAGGENLNLASVTTPAYTDDGTATGTAATPPTVNSATTQYPIWVPVNVSELIPAPFSMPENAFSSYTGLSQRAPIGSFALPAQPYAWTPIVWGHIGAFGIELSANPLMIGCEVLLGDTTTGQLVGRGFGNTLGEVNVMPHYSTPSIPAQAISPTNDLAVVPANHTNPAQGTVYVNLYNDGDIGIYMFSPTDAQLFVMVIPVDPAPTTGSGGSGTTGAPTATPSLLTSIETLLSGLLTLDPTTISADLSTVISTLQGFLGGAVANITTIPTTIVTSIQSALSGVTSLFDPTTITTDLAGAVTTVQNFLTSIGL